jgi:diguanylate cyclase (GGDEF)-like protein
MERPVDQAAVWDSPASPRRTGLVSALTRVARIATEEFTTDELLAQLCRVAVDALEVDGAGVVVTDGNVVRFVHADPVPIRSVERLQELLQDGPCLHAMNTRQVVMVEDLARDRRWPEFGKAASEAEITGVLALPLLAQDTVVGALDLYRTDVGGWTTADLEVAQLFANIAASYMLLADVRNRLRVKKRLFEHRATQDDLTGLPNRALLMDRLDHAIAAAARHGSELAVLFIDLDQFKEINDTLGHQAGDYVLSETARRLTGVLRDSDTLARYAGDEFVIICEDFTSAASEATAGAGLAAIAGRVKSVLNDPPMTYQGVELSVSACTGGALTKRSATAGDLLADADNAMYSAKQRGPGQFALHDPLNRVNGFGRRVLERELRHALDRGELVLHYQPIVAAEPTHPVVAVEALLRWQHPERGLLSAGAFIDIAEHARLTDAIGEWAIDQACAQLRQWHDAFGDRAQMTVFINLSPRELANPRLDQVIRDALGRHDVPANRLGFEIVERYFAEPLLARRAQAHHSHGHSLAIDDFGIGFSSLSRLVELPVAHAKIDQSITATIGSDTRRLKLADAIVVVAHRLGMQVTAEGVETRAQAEVLATAGCDRLQGYLFGHPQPAAELTARWAAELS